jgi:hypothetical protein
MEERKQSSENTEKEKDFLDFLKKTTIHGLYSIGISKNNFLRSIWIISLIISAALCGYTIMKSINDYLSYEVMTKIREINEEKSIFPTVSICNRNIFTNRYGFEYLKNYSESRNLKDILSNPNLDTLRSNSFVRNAMSNFLNFEKNVDERKKLSYSLKEILISCTFNKKECDENDFDWFYHFTYGNCFKFIPSSRHGDETLIPGKTYGLSIEMYIGVYHELDAIRDTMGLYLIISNSSDYINDLDGIFLFGSTENDITVKRKFSELLPHPFSNCQDNFDDASDIAKFILANNYSYSYRFCKNICLQMQLAEICQCYDSKYIPLDGYRVCYEETDFSCLDNIYKNISQFIALNENCYSQCPFECAKSELLTSITLSRYPASNHYASQLNRRYISKVNPNIEFHDIWYNVLKFNIFYDALTFTSITETASMNMISIISNIGGTLGLFLGKDFIF